MVFSRARFFIVGSDQLPLFEFNVQILASFSEDVDKNQVVVHDSVFILASETENALHFDLVS